MSKASQTRRLGAPLGVGLVGVDELAEQEPFWPEVALPVDLIRRTRDHACAAEAKLPLVNGTMT